MKQAMTVSIMGVNEANFRATERLTSSLSPMLGPQVGGEELNFTLSKGLLIVFPSIPLPIVMTFSPRAPNGQREPLGV